MIQKELPTIKENVLLSDHTTFRIGGAAKYFYEAENTDNLIKAVKVAKELKLPFFILGGGSNLLVSDKGFGGLIIKIKSSRIRIISVRDRRQSKVKSNKIIVEAGVNLGLLVALATKNYLSGLEWAVGIPGTIGGAVRGNSGAFGQCTAEAVEKVKVLDLASQKIKEFTNKDCKFEYRGSIFKQNKNLIILSVELKLKKDGESIQETIRQNLEVRRKKIPPLPSAGSIFKNLEIVNLGKFLTDNQSTDEFLKLIPKEKIKGGKIPTGFLIEECGLCGKKIGGAQISEIHANFIVNIGGAKAEDIIKLINLCKKEIKKKFGIKLEEEVQYLGEV